MKRTWCVELCSQIETGAGIQLRSPEPGVVTFLAPWDSSPQPMWFHFRIRGAKGWRVRFVLMNAARCLGGPGAYSGLRVRPVVTEDPPVLPPSRRRWRRIPKEDLAYDAKTGRYTFEVDIRSGEAYVAHCYPYGPAEWKEFIDDFKGCPWLASGRIGRTELGQPMPQAHITEGKRPRKKVIWLTARHHSGETPGSWALEGTLRWLLSDERRARYLRRLYLFRVVPFADLDGVIAGFYGKERAPLDFNRAYVQNTPRPEVGHILRQFFAMGSRNLAFFDYHAPGAGDPHQLFIKTGSERTGNMCREFGAALAATKPAGSWFDLKQLTEPSYMGDEKETTSTGAVYLARGILSMTFEISYARTFDNHVMTRKDYLAYGAAIGKALYKLLHAHENDIEATGLIEQEEERKPFPEYRGRAFLGGFLWAPARDARVAAAEDAKGEVLRISLLKKSSSVHLAAPRRKLGEQKQLRLAWRFVPKSRKAAVRAQVTVFYYGTHGLRMRKEEKLLLEPRSGRAWKERRIKLNLPKGARKVRVSFRIDGGRGEFALREPLST